MRLSDPSLRATHRSSLLVSTLLALTVGSTAAFDLKPGKAFPKIPLPESEAGKLVDITEFRGQKLMLHLFASW